MTTQVRRYPVVLLVAVLLALAGCQRDVAAPSAATTLTTTTTLTAHHPNPSVTPGVVLTTSRSAVCTPGWASQHRKSLTVQQKAAVLRAYGYPAGQKVTEYDHLISLELGGGNGTRNIFPMLSRDDAERKDRLEGKLHGLVCSGQLDLVVAQERIKTYWQFW